MSNGFWTSTSRYGVIRRAEQASRGQNPGGLVVFVHGIFGNCRKTWARMPEWVLDARSRSLQFAFLVPILDAYDDPNLAIRALHYPYYLIVACKHGVHVLELSTGYTCWSFRKSCRSCSRLAAGSRRSSHPSPSLPELLELHRRCQDLYTGRFDSALKIDEVCA